MSVRLVLIATIAVTILLTAPGVAGASCAPQSVAEQRARAQVIADGVILARARPGKARMRVSRYLKGHGPRVLEIVGGSAAGAVSSIDIEPAAGERWRILGAASGPGTVLTTVCDGSARIDEHDEHEPVDRPRAAAASRLGSSDGAPAWLAGFAVAAGATGLLALRLARRRTRTTR